MEEIYVDPTLYTGAPENLTNRSGREQAVYALLDRLNIPYRRVDHAPAMTIDACREIDRVADRGATILQGRGGYGGAPKDVVLCACSNKQLYEIEHAMQDMDPSCFIIMLQSN